MYPCKYCANYNSTLDTCHLASRLLGDVGDSQIRIFYESSTEDIKAISKCVPKIPWWVKLFVKEPAEANVCTHTNCQFCGGVITGDRSAGPIEMKESPLSIYTTRALVIELERRQKVDSEYVGISEDEHFQVEGPATVLIVGDE